jgi:hypothetical protein
LADADILMAELSAFRLRRVSINEADDPEWRVGRYDDLVFAVAMACWYADQHPPRKPLPLPQLGQMNPVERMLGRRLSSNSDLFPRGVYRT